MLGIEACTLPDDALLAVKRIEGAYTDCYRTEVAGDVSFARYVAAFYATPLFKLERLILKFAVARPSTDAQAAALGDGALDRFAAWSVEARAPNQILLIDMHGRTCSWLKAEPLADRTRLYFGSAVLPVRGPDGQPSLGRAYRALLGFHKLYSVLLLRSARGALAP